MGTPRQWEYTPLGLLQIVPAKFDRFHDLKIDVFVNDIKYPLILLADGITLLALCYWFMYEVSL